MVNSLLDMVGLSGGGFNSDPSRGGSLLGGLPGATWGSMVGGTGSSGLAGFGQNFGVGGNGVFGQPLMGSMSSLPGPGYSGQPMGQMGGGGGAGYGFLQNPISGVQPGDTFAGQGGGMPFGNNIMQQMQQLVRQPQSVQMPQQPNFNIPKGNSCY